MATGLDELTGKSPEEIKAIAGRFAAEQNKEVEAKNKAKAEGEGGDEEESKTDSQRLADESPGDSDTSQSFEGDETPASEDAAAKKGGEDSEDGDEDSDWLTAELQDECTALGLTESDLAEFKSREELDRVLRVMARQALQVGQEALTGEGGAKYGQSATTDKHGREHGTDGQYLPKKRQGGREEGESQETPSYKVELDPDEHGPGVVDEFNRLRDHYEERLQGMEERFADYEEREAQRERAAYHAHFDALVDQLGHKDLFGKAGEESPAQLARRRKLFDAHEPIAAGLQQLGRGGELSLSLLRMTLPTAFSEELERKQRKKLTKKITDQSAGRMGSGTTKPAKHEPQGMEKWQLLYQELEEKSRG